MRTFFDELFYIPKHGTGKMREKAFLARIAVSVFAILFCLSAMGITAYAWFSGSIVSSTDKIVAANYGLDWTITVTDSDGKKETSVNTAILIKKDTDAPKTYSVHIEESDTSTASTGFCVVNVDFNDDGTVDETYHTVQIGEDESLETGNRPSLDFDITLNQAARITFEAHWGTSSHYSELGTTLADSDSDEKDNYIVDNKTIVIGVLQHTEQPDEQEEQQTSDTKTVSKATKPSNNADDATSETTSTKSDTTTSSEKTTSTTSANDTTPSTQTTESTETTSETTGAGETTSTTESSTSATESTAVETTSSQATESAETTDSLTTEANE